MKMVRIKGGLGNQMFQYAYGRALQCSGEEVVFDISFFEKKPANDTSRNFRLHHFAIQDTFQYVSAPSFFADILASAQRKIGIQREEYFQSEKYFLQIADTIRKEFALAEELSDAAKDILRHIRNGNHTVSLHVRRGDYVTNKKTFAYHGALDTTYYEKAIQHISRVVSEEVQLFVFSDDIAWVRTHMTLPLTTVYVSQAGVQDYEELILMSKCQHNIIANSSFSWWGAWLNQNPNKIVIAPKQWVSGKRNNTAFKDIVPPEWIRL